MTRIVPPARPEIGREAVLSVLEQHGIVNRVALFGRRGYYRDTMGAPGVQERGLYDDAICLVSPSAYATFNANTDPSKQRPGMAVLVPGKYRYRVGIHGITRPKDRQYEALVQHGPVSIRRDGDPYVHANQWIGLNIHKGGYGTTGSEGCQTIHPDQWPEFIALVKAELDRHGQSWCYYVLTAREDA